MNYSSRYQNMNWNKCNNSNHCKCDDCDICNHCNCCKCNNCDICNEDENMFIHVHEYESSVKLAEEEDDRHNHRVAGVTGPAIQIDNGANHVHRINNDNTDFFDHFHKLCVTTGPAIPISGAPGKHIHLVFGNTTVVDDHFHMFLFTTQINAPLLPLVDE